MEITLRKADALYKAALAAAKALSVNSQVTVSIYDENVDATLEATTTKFNTTLAQIADLQNVAFELRLLASEANANGGVNALLIRREALNARDAILRSIVTRDDSFSYGNVVELAHLKSRLEALKTSTSQYRHEDSVTTDVLTETALQEFRDELASINLERNNIADKLLGINTNVKLTLTDKQVDTLKKYKLV